MLKLKTEVFMYVIPKEQNNIGDKNLLELRLKSEHFDKCGRFEIDDEFVKMCEKMKNKDDFFWYILTNYIFEKVLNE